MEHYSKHPPTIEELDSWKETGYDPRTGKKIRKKSDLHIFLQNAHKNLKDKSVVVKSEISCNSIDGRSLVGHTKHVIPKEPESLYVRDGKTIVFDDTTMKTYVAARKAKFDIIYYSPCGDSDSIFKYQYQWDPYTGRKILDEAGNPIPDPYGPLCFNVYNLIKWWYSNRLNGLWIPEQNTPGGTYEGHYGDHLGAGHDIFIRSRGSYPERYLFRLPVIDCYLCIDFDRSIPTMGPKLDNDEIRQIYEIASRERHCMPVMYNISTETNLPDLIEMKRLYDIALDPSLSTETEFDYDQISRNAVETLKRIR